MREFLLFSRTGFTTGKFKGMAEAGRLDIVHMCALMALFRSQAHRHDVVFHAVLNGPPNPPQHIEIKGADLRDVRTDEASWEMLLKKVLSGEQNPGITVQKEPMQRIIEKKHAQGYNIYVLSRKGKKIDEIDLKDGNLFVLGDHVGLPKKDEQFVLRYGTRVSLGKHVYLAASCIDIVNYILDRREEPQPE